MLGSILWRIAGLSLLARWPSLWSREIELEPSNEAVVSDDQKQYR